MAFRRTQGADESSAWWLPDCCELQPESPWIRAAIEEEQLGDGEPIPSELLDRLPAFLGKGVEVEPGIRGRIENVWGCSLGPVSIHLGPNVDWLCRRLGSLAFCVGRQIMADSRLAASAALCRRVMAHEITHIAFDPLSPRVRFWGGDDHKRLTSLYVSKYIGDHQIITEIVDASVLMDIRSRRLMTAGLQYPAYLQKMISFPAEGPEHGEAGMYKMTDEVRARNINIDCARARLEKAVGFYRQWRDLMDELLKGMHHVQDKMGPINEKRKGMVENLGDALHIAQDRGAHYEGLKGKGHDDPRFQQGKWHPDDARQNFEGYEKAKRFTKEIFEEFKRKVLSYPKAGSNVRLLA